MPGTQQTHPQRTPNCAPIIAITLTDVSVCDLAIPLLLFGAGDAERYIFRGDNMESEISILSYLVNSMAMLIVMCGLFGIAHKVSSVLISICAYPVYLSLYYFEIFATKMGMKGKQFFRLSIPRSNPKKFAMNFAATLVVLGLLPNALTFYIAVFLSPEQQAMSLTSLIFGSSTFQLCHNGLAIGSVLVIYLISYWVEPDERHPMEKIGQLSVPSLWKGALKI